MLDLCAKDLCRMNRVGPLIWLSWLMAIGAAAQTVTFRNDVVFTTDADRKVFFPDGTPVVGANFAAQLYYGASANSLNAVTMAPASFRNISPANPLAGTWIGGTRTLDGFSELQTVTLQVRAWDATGGLTYDQAQTAGRLRGESATFTFFIPPEGTGIPQAWYMENLRSFTLVPEPGVVALAVLGIAGVLFWKRLRS